MTVQVQDGLPEVILKDDKLALVFHYCSSCHAQSDQGIVPGFLVADSEAEAMRKLVPWKKRILRQLKTGAMPPQDSTSGEELGKEENKSVRSLLIHYIEALDGPETSSNQPHP